MTTQRAVRPRQLVKTHNLPHRIIQLRSGSKRNQRTASASSRATLSAATSRPFAKPGSCPASRWAGRTQLPQCLGRAVDLSMRSPLTPPLSILNVLRTYEELLRNFSVNANAQLAPVCVGEGDERGGDGAGKRLGVNALLTRKGFPAPMTPASERLQSLATANRLLTATTKTAPPRKSTRFAMIRVVPSPT